MDSSALKLQTQNKIIDAIKSASDAELSVLADIRNVINGSQESGGITIRRPSRTTSTTQKPKKNELGNKISAQKSNNKDLKSGQLSDNLIPKKGSNKAYRQKNQAEQGKNEFKDNLRPEKASLRDYLEIKKHQNSDKIESKKTQKQNKNNHFNSGRDGNGRFSSKKQADELAQKKERHDDIKMQEGFLKRLGGVIGESTKAIGGVDDDSAIDVAGSAGGSFWRAGKEAANVASNATNNVVSMHEWLQGKTKSTQSATRQPAIQKPNIPSPVLGKSQTKSAKGFAEQNRTTQAKSQIEQAKTSQKNDQTVISLLEELVDKNNASSGGGLFGSLLGGMAIKSIGKKIGVALGTAIMSGLGLGKLKSLLSKKTSASNDIGIDFGKSDAPSKGKHKKRKGKAVTSLSGKNTTKSVTEKAIEKGALKTASKVAGKTALRAIPFIGTAISAGIDAVDGYTDTDAQKAAFGLNNDHEVSKRHKTEYALANIADMGGLVSGGAGLLSDGARFMGFNNAAEALSFNTEDIAKSLDSNVSNVISLFSSESSKSTSEQIKQSESEKTELVKAVIDGTGDTTKAVNSLTTQFQMLGAKMGEDGKAVPVRGSVPLSPNENHFGDGLNIGGSNAKNRSFRNNNFGNLAFANQKGARLEDANAKGERRFAKFDTPEEGMRALAKQITSYSNGTSKAVGYQKLNTVESIIAKYAPANENNTQAYIANLSKSLGVSTDQQLDLSNPQVMTKMIRGIATIEGGNPQVTDKFIEDAIGKYDANSNSWAGKFSAETLAVVNQSRSSRGLNALSSDDQFSTPESISSKKKNSSSDTKQGGVWNGIKNIRNSADAKFAGMLASSNVSGIAANRPTSELTLPKNMNEGDLPPSLKMAMLPANQIATATKVKRAQISSNSTALANINSPENHIYAASGSQDHADIESSQYTTSQPTSIMQSIADIVLPSLGDTAKNMTQGFTSHGMIDDALSGIGLTRNQVSAFSPLTGMMTKKIDGGFHGAVDSLANVVQQPTSMAIPAKLPTVTNLSASGIRMPVSRDKASNATDTAMLTQLQKIATTMDKLLSEQKDANGKGKDPNKTTSSAQPSPRSDIPLGAASDALADLLRDIY